MTDTNKGDELAVHPDRGIMFRGDSEAPGLLHKLATDVAGACRDIVQKTAMEIQKRKYVKVEGWQAIANAFGCVASSRDVQKVYDEGDGSVVGFKAVGEVRRSRDGMVLATAEGFVGRDETMWFGGTKEYWNEHTRKRETKQLDARPEYAVRAMAQTRAISRACRSAFAFVVVMIDENLDTTPAEEVEEDGHGERTVTPASQEKPKPIEGRIIGDWREVTCTYGKMGGPLRGKKLGALEPSNLRFLHAKFSAMRKDDVAEKDREMVAGLAAWESDQ